MARVEQERKAARASLAEADARLTAQAAATVRLDDLRAYCATVRTNLTALDFASRRDAVEALVERVVANGTNRSDWQMVGSIPVAAAGNASISSGRYGHRRPQPPARA